MIRPWTLLCQGLCLIHHGNCSSVLVQNRFSEKGFRRIYRNSVLVLLILLFQFLEFNFLLTFCSCFFLRCFIFILERSGRGRLLLALQLELFLDLNHPLKEFCNSLLSTLFLAFVLLKNIIFIFNYSWNIISFSFKCTNQWIDIYVTEEVITQVNLVPIWHQAYYWQY